MNKELKEQVGIVEHYMNNMDEYPTTKEDGYWGGLKETKLKNKNEDYINKINDLINERINNGKVAFHKKYNVK